MIHSDMTQLFLKWFKINYKEWFVFANQTGFASQEKVKYGVPSFGGGFDQYAFGPGAKTEFFEIKTLDYPRLSKKQIRFRDKMIEKGFKCWVFKELPGEKYYIIDAFKYRPHAQYPY